MDELTKSKIRICLTKAIDKLLQVEIGGLLSIGEYTAEIITEAHTAEIMAEAALQVLVAIEDGETYLRHEGYLKKGRE